MSTASEVRCRYCNYRFVYHVLNRGNGRADVFHKEDDYSAFVRLMQEAH